MKGKRRKAEGEVLQCLKWQGNTVTNDAELLERKAVYSPQKKDMYACARHAAMKLDVWFETPERLEKWKAKESREGWMICERMEAGSGKEIRN